MKLLTFFITLFLLPGVFAATPLIETTGTLDFSGSSLDGTLILTFEGTGDGGSSGGGGGGGGAAGDQNPCLAPPVKTSHIYDSMEAGKTYTLRAPNNQFSIKEISFSLTKSYEGGATVILTHIERIECATIPPVPSDMNGLDYEQVDYIGFDPANVAPGVEITFQLSQQRLKELEGEKEEVQLFRYDGTNWNPLPTTLVEESPSILTYTALSPGLSNFAIAIPAPVGTTAIDHGEPLTGSVIEDTGMAEVVEPPVEEEIESVTETQEESRQRSRIPFWSIIVVVLIGGALGAYYYYDNKKKEDAVNKKAAAKQEKEEPAIGFADVDEEAFAGVKDPVAQLHDYVDEELREGFSREEILAELRKSGWPENIIMQVLDDFREAYLEKKGMSAPHDDYAQVSAFLTEKLRLGYDIGVIKRSLTRAGWNAQLIDSLLTDIQGEGAAATAQYSAAALENMRSFIAIERKKGFTKEQIKAALLKAGWHEGAVDKELGGD